MSQDVTKASSRNSGLSRKAMTFTDIVGGKLDLSSHCSGAVAPAAGIYPRGDLPDDLFDGSLS